MKNRLTSVFAIVLCMALMTVAAMSVSAAGEGTTASGSPLTNSSNTQSVSSSADGGSSSAEPTVSDPSDASGNGNGNVQSGSSSGVGSNVGGTVSDSDTSSGDTTASDSNSSSDNESGNATSGSENTSSETTSSKVNKPIQSTGEGGGNFIDQDGDELASQNGTTSQTASSGDGLISEEYVEDDDTDTDFFEGNADTVASNIYKIIWIPILLSVLCIAALVFVNIWFRKKYPKPAKAGAHAGVKKEGPHRRKKSKKFKFTIEK